MDKIINSNLINLIHLPYKNRSIHKTIFKNELFDNTTKEFFSKFKPDIQQINAGKLSIKKFKKKIGKNNFALLAETANLCVTDTNKIYIDPKLFAYAKADYIDLAYPDNAKYNKIGNDILADIDKRLYKASKRAMLLEKAKGIASMDIIEIGKMLEAQSHNKPKVSINGQAR